MKKSLIGILFFCFVLQGVLHAQSLTDTSANLNTAITRVRDNFYKSIGDQSWLYNGEEYNYYDPAIKGNPYLMDVKDWSPGSVTYNGFSYTNINMLYDIFNDQVIVLLPNGVLPIILLSEKVSSFDLLGHRMVYLANKHLGNGTLKTGFYDELYGGNTQILARREKSKQTQDTFQTIISYFLPSVSYYITKNGVYYPVNNQGEILAVLKDHKKELQQYIKGNNIKYRKDREQAMVKIAAYYDHLTE